MILPKTKTPSLDIKLINGSKWSLENQKAPKYTLITFYRGLHCPVCKKQLENLSDKLESFVEKGVNVIAVSMDSEKRAKISGEEWNVDGLPIGYEMSEEKAREWGLYISKAISDKEPSKFSEPGMFLIDKDQKLYFSSVQTMPFARPDYKDILNAIDFIEKKDYPPRGEN
ncbi:thioredoxin peroxidase [Patiriisocius marinistellae]|uniref:Thioredoxin peroxidase n=1 Tax=Patiriisocius marinistellae TaxID=2494560 RepID=A0A5J4FVU0_9FLAO|nr:peroxiredoxin-like family protein [Patiriisocius marinistellae]GEQ85264.1 thioredoxin peroxidase [Patiriisocius marinistellae]